MQVAIKQMTDPANAQLRDQVPRSVVESEFHGVLRHNQDIEWARKWTEHSFENLLRLLPREPLIALFDSVQSEAASGTNVQVQ